MQMADQQEWCLIMAPKTEHSAKPEWFIEMTEQYFPHLSMIELSRLGLARPGWAVWGRREPN
jgi:N6-adenosine-specific RNA methylase IME4